jgi:hypothetical protein
MWHSDLHTGNIFVDPNDPVKIVGVIDWQSVHLSPLFLQARTPALLNFDGPLPESFDVKLPEDFDSLSPKEQENAKRLSSLQSLYKLYEVACFKTNVEMHLAMRARKTLGAQITGLIGSVFSDGEPHIQSLLIAAQDNWEQLVKHTEHEQTPCPSSYSDEAREMNSIELGRWNRSVELMDQFVHEMGAYRGWDGWVSAAEYEVMQSRLRSARDRFIERESRNEEERQQWRLVFPFPAV